MQTFNRRSTDVQTFNRRSTDREPASSSILRATLVSVLLHGLLLWTGWLIFVPLSATSDATRFESEDQLNFTFVVPGVTAQETRADAPPAPTQPRPSVGMTGPPGLELSPSPSPSAPRSDVPGPPESGPSSPPSEDSGSREPLPEETERPVEHVRPEQDRPRAGDLRRALEGFRASAPSVDPRQAGTGAGNVFVPDLSQTPFSGFGVGNLEFESRDYDWSDYGRQVYVAIWRAWHNRLWMTTEGFEKWSHQTGGFYLEHQAAVRFVIEDNGEVTGITLEDGSGCGPLDDSALDALAEVILPPLPHDFPRDREVVHARFIARGPIRGLRSTLNRLKALGQF